VKYRSFVLLLVLSFASNTIIAQTAKPATATATQEKRPDYAVPFVNKTLAKGLVVTVL